MADPAGPSRLDRVLVSIRDVVVVLPWETREALLEALRSRDDGQDVIAAFDAAGAKGTVELNVLGQVVVVETIRDMETKGRLADGLDDLLDALVDELHERER